MKKLFLVLVAGLMALAGNAQHSYLSAPGVAVFYPANYDASDMLRLLFSNGNFIRLVRFRPVGRFVRCIARQVRNKW